MIIRLLLLCTFFFVFAGCDSNSHTPAPVTQPPADQSISAEFPFQSQYLQVLGSNMHYVDEGEGNVILLLHGNPESIYSWRNVIPHLTPHARVIAVDLIGMGKSDKPPIDYYFTEHSAYLSEFINLMGLENITIVGHDWGSGLAFHYATEHQDNVSGLVFFEAVLDVDSYDKHTEEYRDTMQFIRSDVGKESVLDDNIIVEPGIQDDVIRTMTEEEIAAYRAPFATRGDRLLTWRWVLEIPIDGEPAQMVDIVSTYNQKLLEWDLPMLHLYGEPGKEYGPETAIGFAAQLKQGLAVSVGPGLHYVMEDQPHRIGQEIATWFQTLPAK